MRIVESEHEVYLFYEDLMIKHLRVCRDGCDMDNSCKYFDTLLADRDLCISNIRRDGFTKLPVY